MLHNPFSGINYKDIEAVELGRGDSSSNLTGKWIDASFGSKIQLGVAAVLAVGAFFATGGLATIGLGVVALVSAGLGIWGLHKQHNILNDLGKDNVLQAREMRKAGEPFGKIMDTFAPAA